VMAKVRISFQFFVFGYQFLDTFYRFLDSRDTEKGIKYHIFRYFLCYFIYNV